MFPLKDTSTPGSQPFWVIVIIALNIWVFYLELTSPNPDAFIAQYSLIPSQVDFGNLVTLKPFITSQFLHAGFLHIISNMWFLWIFGDNVEDRLGKLIFPLFYLASGVAGAFLQYVFVPNSDIPMLGASGAIAGVLGAYFALFKNHSVKTLIPVFGFPAIVEIPATLMLFYWFVTQLFSGAAGLITASADIGGVAFFAHIGGFVFGWLIAKVFFRENLLRQ